MIAFCAYRSVAEVRRATAKPAGNPEFAAFRRSLGLTQKDMAERFGVSASTIDKCETGKRSVPPGIRQAMRARGA